MADFIEYLYEMRHRSLDHDSADRLLGGAASPDDAPPEVAAALALLDRVRDMPTDIDETRLTHTVAAMAAALDADAPRTPSARRSTLARLKVAAAGLAGALTLTTGLAAANALPGAVQSAASSALAKVGVNVPRPNANRHHGPDASGEATTEPTAASGAGASGTAGTSTGATATTTKGSQISNTAHSTDATGVDKGATVCRAASDGQCQAGQHGGTSTPSHDTKPAKPTPTTVVHGGSPHTTVTSHVPAAPDAHAPVVSANSAHD